MVSMMISAVMVVKGNPPHLLESLQSLGDFVAEIVIIDIGILPEAQEIINQIRHIQVIPISGDISYVELVRERSKQYAQHEWILFLDPDEVMTEGLKRALKEELKDNYDYFRIPRRNIIFGKWIKHSRWWPDYQVRLFKRTAVVWPKQLHAQPRCHGQGYQLPAEEEIAIKHYNYENLDEFLSKMSRYARVQAQELFNQLPPYTLATATRDALDEFFGRFFAAQGYKDGVHGFILSILQMFYSFLVYFYYWEFSKTDLKHDELCGEAQNFFQKGFLEANHYRKKSVWQKLKYALIKRLI